MTWRFLVRDVDVDRSVAVECRAEIADPAEPAHLRYVLRVLSQPDGSAASWYVWGNRRGINVGDACDSRDEGMRRAAAVLNAIIGPLPP